MFKKILIANRGEIAVRIIRTAREMGIQTIALYEPADRTSLHVRLADECIEFHSQDSFFDQKRILEIAAEKKVDAIHPGYGYLAENPDFIRSCQLAGIVFIGPSAQTVELVSDKIYSLSYASKVGAPVIQHSEIRIDETNLEAASIEAEKLGYPVVIKSCRGGRGRGERLVSTPDNLLENIRRAQSEAYAYYGDRAVYLEKAVLNSHLVSVHCMADVFGNIVTFPEIEGSILFGNQKLIVESPAPCLDEGQRQRLQWISMEVARRFKLLNAASVEYLIDPDGQLFFLEIKPRIQMEHPVVEMVTQFDLVREQILIAAGEAIQIKQENLQPKGAAILCRIVAEDPWKQFLPSPGQIKLVRTPGGLGVRFDTHVYSGCVVPPEYDTLIGKLIAWGQNREISLKRLQVALEELKLIGIPTNSPLLQKIILDDRVREGQYSTDFDIRSTFNGDVTSPTYTEAEQMALHLRDLAIAAAFVNLYRSQVSDNEIPAQFTSGWHRRSRQLPH